MKLEYCKDESDKEILMDSSGTHQVMMEWEKPYMEYSIEKLQPFGNVLEIGFGMGYSATSICSYENVAEYNVIECSPEVWEKFEDWKLKQRKDLKINLIKGRWEDVIDSLDVYNKFDCIYFDDYNYENNMSRFKTFGEKITKYLKIGSRLCVYSTSCETDLSEIFKHECFHFKIDIPEKCKYAKGNMMYVPIYTLLEKPCEFNKQFPNIVKDIIDNDTSSKISPLVVDDFENTKGTGFCNSSILKVGDKFLLNIRHVEYSFFYSKKYQSKFTGPLCYYHPDDDLSLRTNNYFGELDIENLEFINYKKIDTSEFDEKPKWNFIGLEDARIVNCEGKTYLVGVRRDTTTNGQGRMEFSEIEEFKEVSRKRIEVPDEKSYCEKNWMPINDMPYHFVKWTNPTEVVKVDLEHKNIEQISIGQYMSGLRADIRGGSSVIRWDENTYMAITHECYFTLKNNLGDKDAIYKHRFVLWDTNFNIKLISRPFDFMTGQVEFCIGLEQINDKEIVIVFGYYDSCCYAIKCSKEYINNLIWSKLNPF
ncbi:class I SAM-dependent methyltransferase [Flavobacteriaceae bacterium]|nr:class I SAM-dependent methyltransferase [Flavobacteriaceae bacterium]